MQIKILRVGDPHAKIGNLEEMKNLFLFVDSQAKDLRVDRIEVLGDLFHTHAVVRLEVLQFWTWALDLLSKTCETVVLVGNHDISGDHNSNFSSLSVFKLMNKQGLIIIDKPRICGAFGYMPYMHDANKFISAAKTLSNNGAKVLVCHQTIEGSKYESGMYAPDGVPAGEWSERFVNVISGHIHSEQEFGNFIYPGTARWDSVADANRRKGIWLYTHEDSTGMILGKEFISTEKVCSPIQSVEYKEGETLPTWPENARMAVELIGSSAWVSREKEKLKGKCSIKTKITDQKKTEGRKTGNSLEHFLTTLFSTTSDREGLVRLAKEYGIV